MSSLAKHLSSGEAHGSLPFSIGCPVCRRERLFGDPAAGVTLRPAVAAALVVLGTDIQPAVVTASDGDGGLSAPPSWSPAPGDDGGDLTPDGPEGPPGPDDADEGQGSGVPQPSVPLPVPEAPNPAPPIAPPPAATPAPAPPAPPAAPAPPAPPAAAAGQSPTAPAAAPSAPAAPVEPAAEPPPPKRAAAPAEWRPEPPAPVRPAVRATDVGLSQSGGAATQTNVPSQGTYEVRPGDSLWSIAHRLLQARGHTPTAAPVARVVHQRWDMNSARIRSGDADLIEPGTRLVLPRA